MIGQYHIITKFIFVKPKTNLQAKKVIAVRSNINNLRKVENSK